MSIRDFKAKQIRTSNIIASGSYAGTSPSILIYSSSAATNSSGGQHADLLTGVGTDVFMFVSGSTSVDSSGDIAYHSDSASRVDTTVFGGDLVVSGVLYAEVLRAEVDMSTTGSLSVEGPLLVSGSAEIGPMDGIGASTRGKLTIANAAGDEPDNALTIYNNDVDSTGIQLVTYATTGTGQQINATELTTGTGLQVYGGSNTFSGKVAEIDYDGTSTNAHTVLLVSKDDTNGSNSNAIVGLDIDFNMTDGTAGRALRIDSEQTTGIVAEINADGITEGDGLKIDVNALTTGNALHVYNDGSSRNSALTLLQDAAVNRGAENSILKLIKTNTLLDDTNAIIGLDIDFDGVAGTAGRAMRIVSDQSTGIVAEFLSDGVTTGTAIDISADALTTGKALNIASNSSDTGDRNLVKIHNDHASATGVQMVHLLNDAVGGSGDPILLIESTAAETEALLELRNSNAAVDKPSILKFQRTDTSAEADDMQIGSIKFDAVDDGNNTTTYAQIDVKASDITNGVEGGLIEFKVMAGGHGGAAGLGTVLSLGGEDLANGQHPVVAFFSGSAIPNPDVSFFVSGSQKRGGTEGGTALFGGDVVISGTLFPENIVIEDDLTVGDDLLLNSDGVVIKFGEDAEVTLTHMHNTGLLLSDASGVGSTRLAFGDSATFIQQQEDGVLRASADTKLRIDAPILTFTASNESAFSGDFRVQTLNKTHGLFVDHNINQVQVLSDVNLSTALAAGFVDSNFVVSGAIGSRGTAVRGTSVFGGDVVMSGSAYLDGDLTVGGGDIFGPTDGDLLIQADGDLKFRVDADGGESKTFQFYNGGNTQVAGLNESGDWQIDGDFTLSGHDIKNSDGETVISIDADQGSTFAGDVFVAENIKHAGDTDTMIVMETDKLSLDAGGLRGLTLLESATGNDDVLIGSNGTDAGSYDRVLILSGGNGDSVDESGYADLAFFVSGAIGSRGTSVKGTAVFGGDVVISGTLHGGFDTDGAVLNFGADSDVTLTHVHNTGLLLSDDSGVGTTKLMFGDSATFIQQQTDGELGIDADGTINITAPTVDIDASTEVNISGELEVGGDILAAEYIKHAGDTDTSIRFETDRLTLAAGGLTGLMIDEMADGSGASDSILIGSNGTEADKFDRILILSGGSGDSIDESDYTDMSFFVSGAIGSAGTAERGTSVFGGDVVISGTLSGGSPLIIGGDVQVSGTIDVSATTALKSTALSGSLTQLADGTSYLIAGSNITITSSSNGPITIASTASGGGGASAVGWTGPANNVIASSGSVHIGTTAATAGDADIFLGSDGAAIFNQQSAEVDFRIESNNRVHAVFVDGSTDQIFLLSGSTSDGDSVPESGYGDLALFVSGAIGSRGTSQKGTSIFGGDVAISGSTHFLTELNIPLGLSGSMTNLADGTSYIKAGANITVSSASNGAITITSSGGGGVSTVGWLGPGNEVIATTGSVYIGTNSTSNPDINLGKDGSAVFNEQGASVDFRIESNNRAHAVFVDGSGDQVLILSGGASASVSEAGYNDLAFFVSGAIGSRGTSQKGTAIFGGDLLTSGALFALDDVFIGDDLTFSSDGAKLAFGADGEVTLTHVHDAGLLLSDDSGVGTTKLMFGDAATFIQQQADGQLGIDADSVINITAPTVDIDASTEVNVNGQMTIGGPAIINGAATFNEGGGNNDFRVESQNNPNAIKVDANIDQVLILSGGSGDSLDPLTFADANFFVSGAIGDRGTSERGTAVFGGDVAISGSTHFLTALNLPLGLSGSLTQLADGTSYIKAGSNVTITSASNGAITIAAASGGGSGGGVGFFGPANNVISTSGSIKIGTANNSNPDTNLGADGSAVFNEQSNDVDFRIESNNNTHAFFVDGSEDAVLFNASSTTSDVNFFVSGSTNLSDRHSTVGGVALFGGNIITSGSIVPGVDSTVDLGTEDLRFRNIYTGDLHLRNERGDWTIVEERDYLCVVNNITGKKYKMDLTPLDD